VREDRPLGAVDDGYGYRLRAGRSALLLCV